MNSSVAIGYNALTLNTLSGDGNTAIGREALTNTKTGSDNTAVGNEAGAENSSGGYNVFIGGSSGKYWDGDNNTFIGWGAGYRTDSEYGDNNTFIGMYAGAGAEGNDNLYIGHKAGYNAGYEQNTLRIANRNGTIIKGNFSSGDLYIGRMILLEQQLFMAILILMELLR